MPRTKKKASRRGRPWLRKLANGTLRWYLPKHLTGGKLWPVLRADDSFVDGPENEAEARPFTFCKLWPVLRADDTQLGEGGGVRAAFAVQPAGGVEDGPVRSRGAEVLVEPADHERLLEAASPALRDVLVVLRETGTRPVNLCRATAQNLDRQQRALVLAEHNVRGRAHKTADDGRPLVIPLTALAYEVCLRLAQKRPSGPLFLTPTGRPWTANNLSSCLYYLCGKVGVKVVAYGYRHTRATELLADDTPDALVAAILGHSSTTMLYKAEVKLLVSVVVGLGLPASVWKQRVEPAAIARHV
jgi:integrase